MQRPEGIFQMENRPTMMSVRDAAMLYGQFMTKTSADAKWVVERKEEDRTTVGPSPNRIVLCSWPDCRKWHRLDGTDRPRGV